jgi:hypothetical protein
MKRTKTIPATLLVLSTLNLPLSIVFAQGTAFTYQGRLNASGGLASGLYDFRFRLYSDPLGNTQVGTSYLTNGIPAANGLFCTTIDFGAGPFNGSNYWLEVDVRTNGAGGYTVLNPLQAVTPTPYAVFANTASNLSGTLSAGQLSGALGSANLSGSYANAVTFNNSANSFSGNGSGLTGLNASQLTSGTVPDGRLAANVARTSQVWLLNGNAGTAPGINFLGTSDNQPLFLKVNGQEATRFEPTSDTPNVVGGYSGNYVQPGLPGVTIGGGGTALGNHPNIVTNNGYYATIAGGYHNTVTNYGGAILGGSVNFAGGYFAVIGGGQFHTSLSDYTFIGGGWNHSIGPSCGQSTIDGGLNNMVQSNSFDSVIGGGELNLIGTNSHHAVISGGWSNTLSVSAIYASIGGGFGNFIDRGIFYNFPFDPLFTNFSGSVICGGMLNSMQAGGLSVIGGGYGNTMADYSYESVIGGGAYNSMGFNSPGSVIGGGEGNSIEDNANQATIGGGNSNTNYASSGSIGGGSQNVIQSGCDYSALAGGSFNVIQTNSLAAVIAGGQGNAIQTNAPGSVIGGGFGNLIQANATYCTIGGGRHNTNSGSFATTAGGYANITSGLEATVSGGYENTASGQLAAVGGGTLNIASGEWCAVSGGYGNTATGYASTVPGGYDNHATGDDAFAAGNHAHAIHAGSFVWADGNVHDFPSTTANQFRVRATGGAAFATAVDGTGIVTAGVHVLAGDTAWSAISDKNAKKNFQPVDGEAVLEKLAAIPVEQWNYKWESDTNTPHIGPMAQDFKAAFYPGRDDKSISTLEFDGVELAAIQGLNRKLEQKETEIADLKQKNDLLEKRLDALGKTILNQKPN